MLQDTHRSVRQFSQVTAREGTLKPSSTVLQTSHDMGKAPRCQIGVFRRGRTLTLGV